MEGLHARRKVEFFRPLQYALYRPSGATGSKDPLDFDRGHRLVDKGILLTETSICLNSLRSYEATALHSSPGVEGPYFV